VTAGVCGTAGRAAGRTGVQHQGHRGCDGLSFRRGFLTVREMERPMAAGGD